MLLLSNSLLINLLPLVENLFALGQKPFRLRAKSKGVVVMLLIPVYLLIN